MTIPQERRKTISTLSPHFTLDEGIESGTAIKLELSNIPPPQVLITMRATALQMEKVRALLDNRPISVSSWYRSSAVNRAVGSGPNSQHLVGEAVDFTCGGFGNPVSVCKRIIENKDIIPFDQLILEHTWVHISFAILSGKPRYQVLSLVHGKRWATGLTNSRGIPY